MCQARSTNRTKPGRRRDRRRSNSMADILRGEIWWANLNPTRGREQSGTRPVLVISQDVFNRHSGTVIALALTSQAPTAEFPLTFLIESVSLPKQSWVKISQIRTLSIDRLGGRISQISPEELAMIISGLNEIVS
jgi:mRNA interferase MazF